MVLALGAGHADSTPCRYAAWSAPRAVNGLSPESMVRDAWLVVGRDPGYLLGNDLGWVDDSPVPPRPFIALALDGRDIGKPDGDFAFVQPRGALDAEGTLVVVWAEPDTPLVSPPGRKWSSYRLSSLWSATYRSDDGWSRAATLLAIRDANFWWRGDYADVSADSAGNVFVAVAVTGRLFLLVRRGSRWGTVIPPVKLVAYPQVVTRANGHIAIAYLGPDPGSRAFNSVMVIRSLDFGDTWLAPQAVYAADRPPPQDVKLLRGSGDTLYLLWTGTLSGGIERGAIHLATSPDDGVTWVMRESIKGGGDHLRAVSDQCGVLHVAYSSFSLPKGTRQPRTAEEVLRTPYREELLYTRWQAGWLPARSPFSGLNVMNLDLGVAPSGDLFLFGSARPATVTGHDAPLRPFVATLHVDQRP
jgi:hypothetical protein